MRFEKDNSTASNIVLRVELDANYEVRSERFYFADSAP